MEIETKILQDEFATLKAAIEEAIIKGQKSMVDINDIQGSDLGYDKELSLTWENAASGVVGWLEDF